MNTFLYTSVEVFRYDYIKNKFAFIIPWIALMYRSEYINICELLSNKKWWLKFEKTHAVHRSNPTFYFRVQLRQEYSHYCFIFHSDHHCCCERDNVWRVLNLWYVSADHCHMRIPSSRFITPITSKMRFVYYYHFPKARFIYRYTKHVFYMHIFKVNPYH